MSTDSFQDALAQTKKPDSCFELVSSKRHVVLPPRFFGKVQDCIEGQLMKELYLYSTLLNGVIISYGRLKVNQPLGVIMDNEPYIHLDVQVDFVVFKPTLGCQLAGVVNKTSNNHIGCLVYDQFNVSIPQSNSNQLNLGVGDTCRFTVDKIYSRNRVLSMQGTIASNGEEPKSLKRKWSHDEPENQKKSKKSKFVDMDASLLNTSECTATTSDSCLSEGSKVKPSKHKKKKKKKEKKKELDDSGVCGVDSFQEAHDTSEVCVDEVDTSDVLHDTDSHHNKSKKHKDNEVCVDEVDTLDVIHDTGGHQKKSKKSKKHKDNEVCVDEVDTLDVIHDTDGHQKKSKKSKKHKDNKVCVDKVDTSDIIHDTDGHQKKSKKSKKHKHRKSS